MDSSSICAETMIDKGLFKHMKTCRSFSVSCVLSIAVILMGVAAAILIAGSGRSTEAAVLLFFGSLFLVILVFLTWFLFFYRYGETPFGEANPRLFLRLCLYSLVLGIILDVLTYFTYVSGEFSLVSLSNVLKLAICTLLSYVLFLAIAYQKPDIIVRIKAWSRRVFTRRNVIRAVVAVVLALVLGCAGGKLSEKLVGVSFNTASIFWFAVFMVVFSFVLLRHSAGEHPERCFLVVALAFGCVMCFCTPQATILCWDDDTHFGYVSGLSYLNSPENLSAGTLIESPFRSDSPFANESGLTQHDLDNFHEAVNSGVANAETHVIPGFVTEDGFSTLRLNTACYAPAAVGLWLGRLLHVPFSMIFLMGRLFELLFYSLICFYAIKIAPARKVVLCVLALLPTVLFLASVYSYDYWLNCFAVLGVALTVREICTPEKKLTARAWFGMGACFFLAILPKLIYFPLFGIMFLLPRSKFTSRKQRIYYYFSIVLLILVAIAAFVVPLLFHVATGEVVGDERGGSNINSAGQIAFILSEPLHYMSILSNFLSGYLSVSASDEYALSFAYLGNLAAAFPFIRGITALLLVSVALTNCDSKSAMFCKKGTILWTGIIALGTVILVATSLYAMFTTVGSDTIGGCQPRYLIPIITVFFVFTLNPKLKMKTNSASYVFTFLSFAALMNAACTWFLMVSAIAA